MKKGMALWLSLLMIFSMTFGAAAEEAAGMTEAAAAEEAAETVASDDAADMTEYEEEELFPEWNPDAPALLDLIDYVETVTDESSEDYIPPVDRIATFDMDGTIYGELFPTYLEYYILVWRILKDPAFEPDSAMIELARHIRDNTPGGIIREDMPLQHAVQAARAYAGMSLTEFDSYVDEILLRDVDGFEGMTYGEAFYQPIIEVIEYLQENDFKVYVVSGSDRFICRSLLEGTIDVPDENIIGMDVQLAATHQGDEDGLYYVYEADDELIRTDKVLIKNLKTNKVFQIAQEIGRQPVLSFGNSSGDVSMHMYTINNNKYKSEAFMLIADDDVRDYGNPEKAEKLRQEWEADGFHVISMKNDFRTIYGDDVVKTGSFHWAEELADDRVPSDIYDYNETKGIYEQAADSSDLEENGNYQYVMYLGTNDKDTNEPVCSHEEAMQRAGDILIELFGGYTMQEAFGGWHDEKGEDCQEYTLVIYLSDTTLDKVHEAADALREAFNQSSILIQANVTRTEFY